MNTESKPPIKVLVQQHLAGNLLQEQGNCVFSYTDTAAANHFVSLTMPVRSRDYVHTQLHPIFEMHLPEGYLLALLKRHFGKLTSTDDFGLLQLMAKGIRGRLHYADTAGGESSLTLDDLLYPADNALFNELVQRFALQSAVSGVQPKVLAEVFNKVTLTLPTAAIIWALKIWQCCRREVVSKSTKVAMKKW